MTNRDTQTNNKSLAYAETIALKAVHFILNSNDIRQSFLANTGILPSDFEHSVGNPEFLGGILDFLLASEELLIEFCAECGIAPEEPSRIRQLFPGATLDY